MIKSKIDLIVVVFITGIVCITGTVYATTRFQANEIGYNTTTVADALDSMYQTMFSNNYSTTEKQVGTWLDGKPVYQIAIANGSFSLNSSASWSNLPSAYSIPDLKQVTDAMVLRTSDGSYTRDFALRPESNGRLQYYITTGSITLTNADVLIVQYTKTTD